MDFESSIETVDEVTRKITVTIPLEKVNREMDSALDEVTKTTKLKGFRPGKAPKDLVQKLHGERVRWEVTNRLINSSLQELLKEHKLETVGRPEVDIAKFDSGAPIEFTANVSLFPNPQISGYDKIKVKVAKKEVLDADVDEVLKGMRENKATLRKLEFRNTIQKGDVIDAMVTVESDDQPKSKPEPLMVGVGEGKLPEELDNGLIGMEVGQVREFEIKHADDHREPALRGKKARYGITLQGLSEKILPEINDDFAKSLQFGVETLLELRIKIRKQLEDELKRGSDSELHAAILDVLVKANEFVIPQVLIDDEIRGLLARNGMIDPKSDNYHDFSVENFRETLGEMATKRVKSAIVVDRIAAKENIRIEDPDIEKELDTMAERNSVSKEDLKKYLIKERLMGGLLVDLQRNKTLDFLVSRTEVEYEEKEKSSASAV